MTAKTYNPPKFTEEVHDIMNLIADDDDAMTLCRAILFSSLILKEGLDELNRTLREKE